MLNKAVTEAHDALMLFLEEQYQAEKTALEKKQALEMDALKQAHADRLAEVCVVFGLSYSLTVGLDE